MRILTGDECGWLKECIPELAKKTKEKDGDDAVPSKTPNIIITSDDAVQRIGGGESSSRSRGVVDMCFTGDTMNSSSSSSFAALRTNGDVEFWERLDHHEEDRNNEPTFGTYRPAGRVSSVFGDDQTTLSRPMALASIPSSSSDRLCAVNTVGDVSILDSSSVVATYSPFQQQTRSTILTTMKGSYQNQHLATAMAVHSELNCVAISGRERETTLLDLSTGKQVWKAKNLPPDPQTHLQHPIWTTSLLFLNETPSNFPSSHNVLAAGTAYRQVRLYDVRINHKNNDNSAVTINRRPFAYTKDDSNIFEHRITALCQTDANTLVVGDTTGTLVSVDLRMMNGPNSKLSNVVRFVGPTGSIRKLQKHPTLPYLACVGLDRMLRVYNTTTRKQEYCVYLKQRLNCVLFDKDSIWKDSAENDFDLDVEDQVEDYRDEDDEQSGDSASSSDNDEIQELQNATNSSSSDEDESSSSGSDGGSNDDDAQSDDDDDQDDLPSNRKRRRL